MRLDRVTTLNLVQPFQNFCLRWNSPSSTFQAQLPILMYHSISDDPEAEVHPYYRICTSPKRFGEQMQWLAENDYRGVTLSEGLAALASNPNPRPPGATKPFEGSLKPVVLTFDDGYRDFYTAAAPILHKHRFTATMFLPTGFIADTRTFFTPSTSDLINNQSRHGGTKIKNARECLTWAEVAELHSQGIEFGSHTVSHPELNGLFWNDVELEIRSSKREIESRLGTPCTTFAYPYAFPSANREFVQAFTALLKNAGVQFGVTTAIGRASHADKEKSPLTLKRLPVNSSDDLALFKAKVNGAYDWLGWPQNLSKRVKTIVKGQRGANEARLQVASQRR